MLLFGHLFFLFYCHFLLYRKYATFKLLWWVLICVALPETRLRIMSTWVLCIALTREFRLSQKVGFLRYAWIKCEDICLLIWLVDHSFNFFFWFHLHSFLIQMIMNRYRIESFQRQGQNVLLVGSIGDFLDCRFVLFCIVGVYFFEYFDAVMRYFPLI